MIKILFLLDPAIRSLWSPLAWGLLGGLILRRLAFLAGNDLEAVSSNVWGWIFFCYGLTWFVCLLMLFSANFMTRTGRLLTSLPIATRALWIVRIVSILLTASLPFLLITLMVSIRFAAGNIEFDQFYLLIGLKGCLGLILVALIFQTPDPELYRVRSSAEYIFSVIFFSVGVLLFVLITPASIWPIMVCLAASIFLVHYNFRNVPESFLLYPTELEEPDWRTPANVVNGNSSTDQRTSEIRRSSSLSSESIQYTTPSGIAIEEKSRNGSQLLYITLFRLLVNHWQTYLLGILSMAYASVILDAYSDREIPLVPILFITAWLISIMHNGIIRIYRISHLPIPAKLVFAFVALPALFPIIFGIFLGTGILYLNRAEVCQVCYGEKGVEVPPEYWEIAWSGEVPEIRSPWGESLSPTAYRIYPGSPAAVFNPFETQENQSPRFLALQAKRALEAIHGGSPYTEESIASDQDNPLVELMVNREDYRRGFPIVYSKGKHPEIRLRTWLVGAIIFVCIWLMLGVLGILKYRTSRLQRFFSILFTLLTSATIGIAIFQIFLEITKLLAETRPLNFVPVLLRYFAESIPLSNGVLLLILIATMLLAYKIIESQFEKLEPPLGKVKQIWKEYG